MSKEFSKTKAEKVVFFKTFLKPVFIIIAAVLLYLSGVQNIINSLILKKILYLNPKNIASFFYKTSPESDKKNKIFEDKNYIYPEFSFSLDAEGDLTISNRLFNDILVFENVGISTTGIIFFSKLEEVLDSKELTEKEKQYLNKMMYQRKAFNAVVNKIIVYQEEKITEVNMLSNNKIKIIKGDYILNKISFDSRLEEMKITSEIDLEKIRKIIIFIKENVVMNQNDYLLKLHQQNSSNRPIPGSSEY